MNVQDIFYIASGGAAGALARHAVALMCAEWLGTRFPWSTLLVNVVGCLLLGLLWQTASTTQAVSDSVRLALGTGFLGALTTFSTFGLETMLVWNRSPSLALTNVAANVVLGLTAALAGMHLVRLWNA